MITELIISDSWKPKADEPLDVFAARVEAQRTQLRDYMRKHGKLYMVKFAEDDVRPMWEDQIDSNILRVQIPSPTGFPYECPLCQPYDGVDMVTKQPDRRYMTKIVDPKYPEGFIDQGGVWCKCPCILKGEDRKWLKFIKKELK